VLDRKTPVRQSDRLREVIEERIATGQYLPGARLDEVALATEFETSRTPIREALMQLSITGLIDLRPRRGAIVTEISSQRLYEMFEVMSEIEALCARLAARRMTDADKKSLIEIHEYCKEANDSADPDEYYHRQERFHLAIYSASYNSFLIEQATSFQRRLCAYRRLQLRVRNRIQSSFSEHTSIINALLAGDSELAANLMRMHVSIQGERFADLMVIIKEQSLCAVSQ
jgi:DNA-binding GntR family transcriptional regulator